MAAAVAGVVALVGVVLVPGTAHAADNLTCQGGFATPATGTYNNVLVPSNANGENFCDLNGATVLGNVTVKARGALLITNTSVALNVTSSSAGTGFGGGGLTFSVAMCGTTVGGHLNVIRSSSLVEIGTDDFGDNCVGQIRHNTLNGVTNSISRNRGGVEVEDNQVNGNLTVSYNRGSIPRNRDGDAALSGQSIAVNHNSDSTHTLKCVGNAGIVDSSANSFASVVGQCNP
jgi:hypothetical protein